MEDIKAKQQVVEKIKEASKILVTVSDNPSVDALSAALGLTLLFDKQEKYATAIFSGEVPPAIAFLEPQKTFDETTDSLRDFIIALNKEKADHLRYKVEGDSVKIFITPYKTTIDKDDLEFSQGDYNVELVIALGVDSQEHLDKALEEHGQILHDATVITISAGEQTSNLGGIDWRDANASSLSEMVSGLAEALKEDKKSLVDAQIATALLTGIVAETDRFSNQHTTSKVMTVAAQLMSAGADQQLIATELQAPAPTPEPIEEKPAEEFPEVAQADEIGGEAVEKVATVNKDQLTISHEEPEVEEETLAELDERVRSNDEAQAESLEVSKPEAQDEPVVEETLAPDTTEKDAPADEPAPESQTAVEQVVVEQPASQFATEQSSEETSASPVVSGASSAYALDDDDLTPSLGGTLNATSEQAAEDAHREAVSGQNKTILSHAYIPSGDATQVSNPIDAAPEGFPGTPAVVPGSVGINENEAQEEVRSAYALPDDPSATSAANSGPTFGVGGDTVIAPPVQEPIVESVPAPPAPVAPVDLGLPLPPPLPDFSQGPLAPPPIFPVAPPTIAPQPAQVQPEILGDILAPEPAQPYQAEPSAPQQPASNDPGQFKIPS
jgi:nanoRNase/pAp phosphatase (c-di-AMP/oligoRNAs hydrolase)